MGFFFDKSTNKTHAHTFGELYRVSLEAKDLFWYYSNTFLFFHRHFFFSLNFTSFSLSLSLCSSFSMVSSEFIMSKAFENMINFVLKTHSRIFGEDRPKKKTNSDDKELQREKRTMESIYFDIACPNARTIRTE